MNRQQLEAALRAEEELERRLKGNALSRFLPNAKQWEFLNAFERFLMFSGANQMGKTTVIRVLFAMHLTGRYLPNYQGPRFDRPITAALGGVNSQTTRDHLTDGLLGDRFHRGEGMIPADCFDQVKDVALLTGGVKDQIDYFRCKHYKNWDWETMTGDCDGYSKCFSFAYSAGWERLQGYTLDIVGCDEEPPRMVADELRARTISSRGRIILTMTPLHGYSDVVDEFVRNAEEQPEDWKVLYYSVDDATHKTEEERAAIKREWTGHWLEMPRLWGIPNAGEGMIYKTAPERLVFDPIEIPDEWPRIIGIDIPHTTGTFAATWWAWDQDTDTLYCYDEFKARLGTDGRSTYKDALGARGAKVIPIAWPHDAGRGVGFTGVGKTWVDFLVEAGFNVCPEAAFMTSIDGKRLKQTTISIIDECSHRMQTGRLKISSSCQQLLKEISRYGSEDGFPKKNQDDHLIDSMHKAVMMRDFAESIEVSLGEDIENEYDFDVFATAMRH